ncbi:MAG: di-heme oxidoredictase family protein [Methyloligellaceae bacterium]
MSRTQGEHATAGRATAAEYCAAGAGKARAILPLGILAIVLWAGAAAGDGQRPVLRVSEAARLELGEALPGGAATALQAAADAKAFSHVSANIAFEGRIDFRIGNAFFRKKWLAAPASAPDFDGLGPLFNARSCEACHIRDGRGRPPPAHAQPGEDDAVSMVLRLSIPPQNDAQRAALAARALSVIPEPVYGRQLQTFAIPGHRAEGRIRIEYEERTVELAGGERVVLRRPVYGVAAPGYGPLHPQVRISPRVAPPMIGLGLLEAIPEARILALADERDRDGDGISGRPSRVRPTPEGEALLGRFGWKAGKATIMQQVAEAFSSDMGLSSWLRPALYGDCTPVQKACRAAPHGRQQGEEAEVSRQVLDLVTRYSSNLAPPPRRSAGEAEVLAGKAIFAALGCAACHVPSHRTGPHPREPHLSNQRIWPYTDLLLHDMGEGLADGRREGAASGREWRTPPLWGIGLTRQVSGHSFFLHDGRARSLTEAIMWHGGEARAARDAFAALPAEGRRRLLAFLNSL